MLFNLHTHTHFCDGSDHPEEYVRQALDKGLSILGFSGHAPVPFDNNFAIPSKTKLLEYVRTVEKLKQKYAGQITIMLALEIDFIPGLTESFDSFREMAGLDYTIGSVHLVKNLENNCLWFIDGAKTDAYDHGLQDVFENDAKKAVTAYYRQINTMIINERPRIVGHLDKIKMHNKGRHFTENDLWYRDLVLSTIDVIKQNNCIVEVNTRGKYKGRSDSFFPDGWVLGSLINDDIPLTISTDAHTPEEMTLGYSEASRYLKEKGCKKIYIPHGDSIKSLPLT